MSCANPLDPSLLMDYWLGELPGSQEEPVEVHLLGCEVCSERLQEMAALAGGIRECARGGNIRVVLSGAFLERLARDGFRIRQYAPPAGGKVACTVTAQDDLLIGRLTADLSRASRLDLVLCDASGREMERIEDLPFHPAGRDVILNYPIGVARSLPANVLRMKLLDVTASGEHLIGEYTFDHTPS
jgi:hypothetical protein